MAAAKKGKFKVTGKFIVRNADIAELLESGGAVTDLEEEIRFTFAADSAAVRDIVVEAEPSAVSVKS